MSSLVEATPVSFELELLQLGKDGKARVIDREQCPLELSLAKVKAQQIFEEKLPTGGRIDAIRIVDPSGQEITIYREGWTAP
jgi:hypothetical protein